MNQRRAKAGEFPKNIYDLKLNISKNEPIARFAELGDRNRMPAQARPSTWLYSQGDLQPSFGRRLCLGRGKLCEARHICW